MLIRIHSLSAAITIGDFLIVTANLNAIPSVCVVREVILPSEVGVTWWLTLEELQT